MYQVMWVKHECMEKTINDLCEWIESIELVKSAAVPDSWSDSQSVHQSGSLGVSDDPCW